MQGLTPSEGSLSRNTIRLAQFNKKQFPLNRSLNSTALMNDHKEYILVVIHEGFK
jgi:hypothetical protein